MHPSRSARTRRAIILAAAALALAGNQAAAQTSANVAVVINESSPASVRIGEHYVSRRGIPAENVVRIALPPGESISRPSYAADVEGPIARAFARAGLQDRILYIVLTKGVPLRITGTAGVRGTAASVDSELTLLYRRMTGRPVPPGGPLDNPYYAGPGATGIAPPFTHRDHDIYLVTRIDAFTVEEAIGLIDRGMTPAATGGILLAQRGDARSAVADRWMVEAAGMITARWPGAPVVLGGSAAPVGRVESVLGYFSWGSTGTVAAGRSMELPFVPGSVAATLGSSDAGTFDPKPGGPEPVTGRLVRAGASGAGGNVAEPYLQSSIRPQILFPAYLQGLPLADAFYRALPHLSWQSVIVGDPLVRIAGRPVSLSELDPASDKTTGLPAHFSARRLESLRSDLPGVPPGALMQVMASERHQARDDRDRAIAALTRATELAPEAAVFHLRLAALHEESGNAPQAVAGYRRVVALQPRNVVALNNLAYALARRGQDLEEAHAIARKAYALAPDEGTVLDTMGWIEHLRGNAPEAARLLRTAAQREPDHAEIRLHAALVLFETGAKADSADHLAAALRLNPVLEARSEVRELQRKLGR